MGLKSRLKSLFSRKASDKHYLLNSDFAFSKGDAEGYVLGGNSALAMARGRYGAAVAHTDGITPRTEREGNGRAGVTGGTAWARAGKENFSIAHSKEAQRRSDVQLSRRSPTIRARTPPPPPLPMSKKARRRAAHQQKNLQGRNPNYERNYTNADIRNRHRMERESSNWELYGRESGIAVTDGSNLAFARSGRYMLTNGRQAAFLNHSDMGYVGSTGSGYVESRGAGYVGGGEGVYIESTGGYYSD